MCLAIPMRIVSLDELSAQCEAKGVTREVSLFMMQDEKVEIGDMVMVHVGYALQKVEEEQALESWALLDEIIDTLERGDA